MMAGDDDVASLQARLSKLERINASLMKHVERATDQHGGAYSLFQTAIMLDGRVKARTDELTSLMLRLERSNVALTAAKEEAENANRSKTRFLAAAGHDLLQPLNAARLSTSALFDLPLPPEAYVIAGQVERGLQTIEDLIKTLLDISKLDAGVILPSRKAVRLRPLVAEIDESFARLAEKRGLRLVVRCDEDIVADSDPVLLGRILQNLVSNALRYTARGGVILAVRARAGGCRIDVIDTGSGIAENERDMVFEEFYRGRSSSGEAGLGLGLSIVRRMLSALDHPMVLRSALGHGTRFTIMLPFAAAAEEMSRHDTEAEPAGQVVGTHAVVIENDPETAAAMTRLLDSWGLGVETHSGLEGWVAARSPFAPDILIVDYHLDDGATGLEAVVAIRRHLEIVVPAILVTANHSESVEAQADAVGCEVLLKPVKPAQLRSLLSFMVAGTRVQAVV